MHHGAPLFLDHHDPRTENVRHLVLSNFTQAATLYGEGENSLKCMLLAGDPEVLIDETAMRFDKARWAAAATSHPGLSAAAATVHARVLDKMPPHFHKDEEYRPSKTYKDDHASALASMEKALRQNFHVDTHREGFSVLVAVDSDFRLVVLKNSLQLIRRVAQLWDIFTAGNKMRPGDAMQDETPGDWWDFCCWRQLQKEGWGKDRLLESVTLVIPKGHALIFSSWLLHAGAEWQEGNMSGYNRMHFYFTKDLMLQMQSVFMQDREGAKGTSFSPALHFLPVPVEPGDSAPILPKWLAASTAESRTRLRARPDEESTRSDSESGRQLAGRQRRH